MSTSVVTDYTDLITQFVNGDIDVGHFESEFLARFKNEQRQLPESVFATLDALFGDVDMFCGDDDLRDDDELDETELRASAEKALVVLKQT